MSLELGLGSTSVRDNSNQADFLSPDRPSTKWSSFWTLIISNARETAKTVSHFVPCADFVTDGRTDGRMDLRTCFSGHPYTIAPKGAKILSKISNLEKSNNFQKQTDFWFWKYIFSTKNKKNPMIFFKKSSSPDLWESIWRGFRTIPTV